MIPKPDPPACDHPAQIMPVVLRLGLGWVGWGEGRDRGAKDGSERDKPNSGGKRNLVHWAEAEALRRVVQVGSKVGCGCRA